MSANPKHKPRPLRPAAINAAVEVGTLKRSEPVDLEAGLYPPGWLGRAELLEITAEGVFIEHAELVSVLRFAEKCSEKRAEAIIAAMVRAGSLESNRKPKAIRKYRVVPGGRDTTRA